MDDKKIKYIIIVLSILIVVIIALLTILLNTNDKKEQNGYILDNDNATLEKQENVYLITNERLYFSIRDNIMQKYVKYVEEKNSQKVYDMLSLSYKQENDITVENVISKLPSYSIPKFIPQHMYEKEGDSINNIYIEAIIQNNYVTSNYQINVTQSKEYYVVIIEKEKSTFAIEPIDEELYKELINDNKLKEATINQNENNQIVYENVTEAYIVSEYLNNYANLLKYDTERAYELLKEEYKEIRYPTYSDFEKYIKNGNIEEGMILETYTKQYNDDNSIKYICKDEYGRTYIFDTVAVMNYTVQLDDYTLENETFNEKYKKASNRDKGLLNIDKFFKMINMQDYKSAYAVLDENFKQNYFKTEADFENYMNNKVFRYNKVDYKEYSNKITDIYTYKVVLTDKTEQKQGEVEFDIVMKLLEGTDFVMSFTVN